MNAPRRTASPTQLRQRFVHFWRQCEDNGQRAGAQLLWQELETRYSEPHRHYHVLGHLAHCLDWQRETAAMMQQPEVVEMALWYHDIIYRPNCADNEERSAHLFADRAQGLFSADFIRQVHGCILATVHDRPPREPNQAYVMDIDLASLGQDWPAFAQDSANIRREFGASPAADYYQSNGAFLNSLLQRERIYYSDFFHRQLEQQARANIQRYLQQLRAEGLLR